MDPGSLLLVLLLILAGVGIYFLVGAGGLLRSGRADPDDGGDGPRPTHAVVRDESDSGRARGPGDR